MHSSVHTPGVFVTNLRNCHSDGELRRQGAKIKLQQQPFQILVMLLERPGEVVAREEIQKRLWLNLSLLVK